MSAPQPAHSIYGMSGIERWTSCLASVREAETAPPGWDEPWTADGKAAHALLEKMLKARDDNAARHIGSAVTYEAAERELVQVTVKPEHARAVQFALDYVYELLERDLNAVLWVETRVQIPSTAVPGRLWGRLDIGVYLPSTKTLYVVDYKHGAGIAVDVVDNKQVMGYALALMLALPWPVERVRLGIVQPRSFGTAGSALKFETTSVAKLLEFHVWLDWRASLTRHPDAPYKPDAGYCRWCPAASTCRVYESFALSATGAKSIEEIVTRPLPAPANFSLERVALIKAAEPFIRGFLKANHTVAMGAAHRGYDIPGYKLVNTEARRAWYGDPMTIGAELALLTGLDLEAFYPRALITMTEAEALVVERFRASIVQDTANRETKKSYNFRANKASELAREVMAQYTLKEPSANVTLAPLTDSRPRVDAAASNFHGLIRVDPQE